MTARDAASDAQNAAARPDVSTWVSANAGSGKTRVLTDRVARLLLRGTSPISILCLTYTKAAAAEMQNRLFDRLGRWAMLSDAELRAELARLGEETSVIPDTDLGHARTLFARAIETPGGLKIQTIHAFCEQLLRRFPLEAGVPPRFEIMEDRQAAQLRRDVLEEVAQDAGSGFDALAPHLVSKEGDLDTVLSAIIANGEAFETPVDAAQMKRRLGAAPDPLGFDHILGAAPPDRLHALAAVLASHGKGTETGKVLPNLQDLLARKPGALDRIEGGFLTAKGEIRRARFPSKDVAKAMPEALEIIAQLATAMQEMLADRLAQAAVDRTLALYRFGRAYATAFTARKAALGRLDFDDLIRLSRRLLVQTVAAEWVKYKLDGGIDHILVDEAQDTSPDQWQVISALASDFFSGAGARDVLRTIFVVGDEKQSIYSFQGADPVVFGAKQSEYRDALHDAASTLETCDLTYSFRSATPILQAVDAVFSQHSGHGLSGEVAHLAFHADLPGRVDLWRFEEKPDAPEDAPWYDPVDQPARSDPAQVLARRLADHIGSHLASGACLPGCDQPVSPGDILILVRRRGPLFRAIIKALKDARVPVAGADRLIMNDQLVVQDIMALLRVIATPQDDLSLAAALRSPLFGLTEDDLFSLAHDRPGTLLSALMSREDTFPDACALLRELRARADFLRPHELLERLLTRHGARGRIAARLGPEAEDAVEVLLDLALDYERVEPPTLGGFIDWMAGSNVQVKRELAQHAAEVRVMTVHGAKGLEAPIVILPDTGKRTQGGRSAPPLTRLDDGTLVPAVAIDRMPPAQAQADAARKARETQEAWRLLYVAMTRAEQWLIVCGAGDIGTPETAWYPAVRDGLTSLGAAPDDDGGLSYAAGWDSSSPDAAAPATTQPDPATDLPDWIASRLPPPAKSLEPLIPSQLLAADPGPADPPSGDTAERARLRGVHTHRLLEHLPGLTPDARGPVADQLAANGAEGIPSDLAASALAEVSAVLDRPDLAWIFAPGALAEVSVTGTLDTLDGRAISGQIDRLIVRDGAAWVVDFKSNREVPVTWIDVPRAYAMQLALYHAALTQILPDHQIRAGILWTANASFLQMPHEAVKEMLQSAMAH